MRKIVWGQVIDPNTFAPVLRVNLLEDGKPGEIILEKKITTPEKPDMIYRGKKYKFDEYNQIETCNGALINNSMAEMTIEEADFMLSRSNVRVQLEEYKKEELQPEQLQRLAGFKVQKIITTVVNTL